MERVGVRGRIESVLALDVDGVLLDPERGGDGPWTNELERRFGITGRQLCDVFFTKVWVDVVNGRGDLAPALAGALAAIGASADVEDVIDCWLDADFVPFEPAFALARRANEAAIPVVLVTNQEHRRAAYLRRRFAEHFDLRDVLYSADLGVQKHDPAFFVSATHRLGGDPTRIVFVDDAVHNVDQASAAGWTAVVARADSAWIDEVDALLDNSSPIDLAASVTGRAG